MGSRILWGLLILLLVIAVGGGYYYTNIYTQEQIAQTGQAEITTAPVRQGDLVISVGGVGTLLPAVEVNLGFATSGILAGADVHVGDQVATGDRLAYLDDTDCRAQVLQAGINERQVELELVALQAEPNVADIAAAQANLAEAQTNLNNVLDPASEEELRAERQQLVSVEEELSELLAGMSDDENAVLKADLMVAEIALREAQGDYDAVAWQGERGASSQAAALQQATIAYEKALAQFNLTAAGATQAQLASARAAVADAQAQLADLEQDADSLVLTAAQAGVAQAQAQLVDLLDGPSADELENARLNVQQARLDMDAAVRQLEGCTIKAPFDGVVTAVDAQVGEQVGSEAIVSLADRKSPLVRFWVEELDLPSVAVGNPANVILEAYPDIEFSGEMVRIEPALVDVDGASAVQVWASIDPAQHPVTVLFGMNAEVEVIAGEALGATLVPVQALRELSPNLYAVFIVRTDGELEMRPVEVGIRDFVSAEILSGVEPGDTVSTGESQ